MSSNLFPHLGEDPAEHARPNDEQIVMPDALGRERANRCIT